MLIDQITAGNANTSVSLKKESQQQTDANLLAIEGSTDSTSLSSLAQIKLSHNIVDLNISQDKTSFAYYTEDNSMAVRAHSQTDIKLHQENFQFEISYSAEALGLNAEDFKDNQPITFSFSFQQQKLDFTKQVSMQTVKRTRQPYEILADMAEGLRQVLRDPGNKSVYYELDDEARKVLMQDPKILKLFNELIMLMASINLAQQEGDKNSYLIRVSGKAKPWIDYQEKTELNIDSRSVDVTITINPPARQNDVTVGEASLPAQSGGTETNV